jgi:hypothetical protein
LDKLKAHVDAGVDTGGAVNATVAVGRS